MINSQLKVAIVYDWVNTAYGGAEQVLLALQAVYPRADLVTSVYDPQSAPWAKNFKTIKTSFLNYLPTAKTHHRWWVWLMPLAFETLDLTGYDLVISVTSAFAKGVLTHPGTLHVCYLLTPPRFLNQADQPYHQTYSWLKNPIIKFLTTPIYQYLQSWDQLAATRPDITIPISQVVKNRAATLYPQLKIESPIYPSIVTLQTDKQKNQPTLPVDLKGRFYLIVSRLVPYKRIDLAIKACAQTQRQLVIVGAGPDQDRLEKLIEELKATDRIKILSNLTSNQLTYLYAQAQAVLMPGVEDFGIVALESLAANTPVIINRHSGAAELIKPSQTGLYIEKLSVSRLIELLQEVDQIQWQPAIMKKLVSKYQTTHFQQQLVEVITKHLT